MPDTYRREQDGWYREMRADLDRIVGRMVDLERFAARHTRERRWDHAATSQLVADLTSDIDALAARLDRLAARFQQLSQSDGAVG